MENGNFNVRDFYKQNYLTLEEHIAKSMALNTRHSFQNWSDGGESEELFLLKTDSNNDCIGIDFGGLVSYLKIGDEGMSTLFIFDEGLTAILYELSTLTENTLNVLMRHTPSVKKGLDNAVENNCAGYRIIVDGNLTCIAKPIFCKIYDLPANQSLSDSFLMQETLNLLEYRIACSEELARFPGFSKEESREIAVLEGGDIAMTSAKFIGKVALNILFN